MRKFQTNSLTFRILVTALVAFCYHFSSIRAEDDAVSIGRNNTNHFVIKLLRVQDLDNFMFSPIAVEAILSLIPSGTNFDSSGEIENILRLSKNTTKDFIKLYTNNNILNITQRIYVSQGYSLRPQFKFHTVGNSPNTQDIYLPKEQYEAIADWRNAHKNMMSTNILLYQEKRPEISRERPLDIINIIEFKNDWLTPFDKTRTTLRNFHVGSAIVANTPMMHRRGRFLYLDILELNCTALRMYYKDGSSMTILLPRSAYGLPQLLGSLTLDLFETLNNKMAITDVRVSLPKFRVDGFEMRLEKTLKAVGIQRIFSPGTPLNLIVERFEAIYLDGIKTVSSFQVDEFGTDVQRREVPNIPVKVRDIRNDALLPASKLAQTFHANKPFVYIIQHSSGTPLLVGNYYGVD